MNVVDAVGELRDEGARVEELVREVTGIEVDSESGPAPDRVQRLARGHEVVSDLRRMDLEAEADTHLVEDVDDRVPTLGKVRIALFDLRPIVGWERVEHVPGRRAGEPVHNLDPEFRRGASRVLHSRRGSLAHAFGVAVSPDLRRQDRLVALVDSVAHRLPDEVVGDGPAVEAVPAQDVPTTFDVARRGKRLVDFEVVAPAGKLEPVKAPGGGFFSDLLEGQVGPLAGE